jgi:hypothetical protein
MKWNRERLFLFFHLAVHFIVESNQADFIQDLEKLKFSSFTPWRYCKRGLEVWLHSFSTSVLDGSEWLTSRLDPYAQGNNLFRRWVEGWGGGGGGSKASLLSAKREFISLSRIRSLDRPALGYSLYRLRYPGSLVRICKAYWECFWAMQPNERFVVTPSTSTGQVTDMSLGGRTVKFLNSASSRHRRFLWHSIQFTTRKYLLNYRVRRCERLRINHKWTRVVTNYVCTLDVKKLGAPGRRCD